MKALYTILLAGSLALNAGFAYLLLSSGAETPPVPIALAGASAESTPPKIDATIWPELENQDLRSMVARLRASGFPLHVIRAIVAAQLQEQQAAQIKALMGDPATRPFWKSSMSSDPAKQMAFLQLRRESEKTLNDLLGKDPDEANSNPYMRRNFDFLPADKAGSLRQLLSTFDDKRSEIFAQGYSSLTDRAKLDAIQKEQHDAIAAILSPAELLEYDLRNSSTAQILRDQLAAFAPSEEEFRKIFQLRQPFDEKFTLNSIAIGGSPAERNERMQAQKQLTEQIKAALGPERAAAFERTSDFGYIQTSQLIARLGLPENTTENLYAVQKDIEQRRRELYRPGSSGEERAAQLAALQQEALSRLTPLLGGNPQAVEAYKRYGGYWLQSLAPAARSGPTETRGAISIAPNG